MSAPTLYPYQREAIDSVAKARAAGMNRLLLKMPTGTGKTVTFAAMLAHPHFADLMTSGRAPTMLVIAHREELLDQAVDKISRANPRAMVSIEQGSRGANAYSDVVVASIQTLAAMKFRRLKLLMRRHNFRIVIVDEAHHAAAPTYRTVLAHLGFLPLEDVSDETNDDQASEVDVAKMTAALAAWDQRAPKDQLLVGVTATPNRSDAIGLGCVFQSIAFSYALRNAIEDGWLVPITPWVVETNASLDEVRLNRGDFNQRELADAVNNDQRNRLAVSAWEEYAADRSTIAFTVDVAHAHALAKTFTEAGVRAAAVSGETPREERRRILDDFQEGKLQVVTNCMVLTEGTDLPRASCILHAKPTKSATLYEQMTGRGLRLFPGKTDCVVIDLVDIARRHSLQAAPVLYGLPPNLNPKGKPLQKLATEIDEFLEAHPGWNISTQGRVTLEQLQAHARTFDIWKIPDLGDFGIGRTLRWMKISDDEFRLQYPWADGSEVISVAPDLLGHFAVSLTMRPHDGSPVRQRTLVTDAPTAVAAAALAEAFVLQQRNSVVRLRSMDESIAGWRSRPASPKQLALLARLHVPFKPGINMGEASDLIDLANARRK